jgi:hypothetical protein
MYLSDITQPNISSMWQGAHDLYCSLTGFPLLNPEKFDDTKGEIWSRDLKKARQHNGRKKMDKKINNGRQRTVQKRTKEPSLKWVWTQVLWKGDLYCSLTGFPLT